VEKENPRGGVVVVAAVCSTASRRRRERTGNDGEWECFLGLLSLLRVLYWRRREREGSRGARLRRSALRSGRWSEREAREGVGCELSRRAAVCRNKSDCELCFPLDFIFFTFFSSFHGAARSATSSSSSAGAWSAVALSSLAQTHSATVAAAAAPPPSFSSPSSLFETNTNAPPWYAASLSTRGGRKAFHFPRAAPRPSLPAAVDALLARARGVLGEKSAAARPLSRPRAS
jgi:hypothetical protein